MFTEMFSEIIKTSHRRFRIQHKRTFQENGFLNSPEHYDCHFA